MHSPLHRARCANGSARVDSVPRIGTNVACSRPRGETMMSSIGRIATLAVLIVTAHDCTQAKDSTPAATKGFDQSHAQWTEVLKSHVKGDKFDYQGLKRDRAPF